MKRRLLFLILPVCFLGNAQSGFGEQQIIYNEANADWVVTADINGDNHLDIIAASLSTSTIAWYQNIDGTGNFSTQHIITDYLTDTKYVNVIDIDNDGDLDVLGLSFADDLAVWYENLDGNGSFSTQKIITTTQDLPKTIIGADIDGDGDKDVVICSRNDDTIAWYENLGGQGVWSSQQTISTTALNTSSVVAVDIDSDGQLDLVSDSSSNSNNPAWYRNMNGEGLFGGERIITSENSGTIFVGTADLDGDNDQDVISLEFGGDTIAWFENLNGFGTFGPKQIITTAVDAPRMFRTGDIDNDGDIDLVSVSSDDKLAWYKNDGLGNFSSQIIIDDNFITGRAVSLSDFDEDGYLDLVAVRLGSNGGVFWYRNQTYLGIEENPLQTITLTPNPTSGILQLYNVQTAVKKITVYDVLGKPVLQQNGDNKTIDLSSLQQGLYLIKIETATGSTVKKVVKQ